MLQTNTESWDVMRRKQNKIPNHTNISKEIFFFLFLFQFNWCWCCCCSISWSETTNTNTNRNRLYLHFIPKLFSMFYFNIFDLILGTKIFKSHGNCLLFYFSNKTGNLIKKMRNNWAKMIRQNRILLFQLFTPKLNRFLRYFVFFFVSESKIWILRYRFNTSHVAIQFHNNFRSLNFPNDAQVHTHTHTHYLLWDTMSETRLREKKS